MNKIQTYRFTPLMVAIGIVVGILIGSFYANHFSGRRLNIINNSGDKLNSLLHIIDDQYVDSVSVDSLVEQSLPEILKKLDPHSVYIPAAEAEASMQDLKGSFSGIGVQFLIYQDTVCIVKVIAGGPSEGVGLQPGDRLVSIDGKPHVGSDLSADKTRDLLKGRSGTTVEVGVVRPGVKGVKPVKIVRGDVPIKSVDGAFMLDKTTGYIKVNSFGDTTYAEFLAALATLGREGFTQLVVDLRGNLGGYMSAAVQLANEFLPKGRLIVYTQGRKSPREEYRSNGRGAYQTIPLVVLVDETSASSSEIFAGAIQDNDRGTLIGRRTFGKGLVQVPIEFNDGSMLRLTKARYYTPAGRCVQKPYTPGDEEDYDQDLTTRAERGEYFYADSIKVSGKRYTTRIGRIVYGGGGIIPDIFVSRDTVGMNTYFREVYLQGMFSRFAFYYVDTHRHELSRLHHLDDLLTYAEKHHVVEDFVAYAERMGIRRRNRQIRQVRDLLTRYILFTVVDDALGTTAAEAYSVRHDEAVRRALHTFETGTAFPSRLTPSAR